MAAKIYGYTSLTGGGVAALDSIDGSILNVGDLAYGTDGNETYSMILDGSGDAESSPDCIAPDSNAGVKRWKRRHDEAKAYRAAAPTNGHMASLDADGDLVDSGKIAANVVEKTAATPSTGDSLIYNGSLWVPSVPYRKNIIINGDTLISQRGISFSGTTTIAFPCDRFKYAQSNDGSMNVLGGTNSGSVPTFAQAGTNFTYSLLLDVSTADAALAAGQYSLLEYAVEGYDIAPHRGKQMTLSFWIRSTKTGTYSVAFKNSGTDRSYVSLFTISSASTWEKKIITFTMHDGTSGTWNWTNGSGLRIAWSIGMGSTYQTATTDSWINGNFNGTAACANGMDHADNDFRITGVQLEVGSVATPFEIRPFAEELALCQRYYEKSYDVTTPVGTAAVNGYNRGVALSTVLLYNYGQSFFSTTKRDQPTVNIYSHNSGSANLAWREGVGDDRLIAYNRSTKGFSTYSDTGALTVGWAYLYHWTADAEL